MLCACMYACKPARLYSRKKTCYKINFCRSCCFMRSPTLFSTSSIDTVMVLPSSMSAASKLYSSITRSIIVYRRRAPMFSTFLFTYTDKMTGDIWMRVHTQVTSKGKHADTSASRDTNHETHTQYTIQRNLPLPHISPSAWRPSPQTPAWLLRLPARRGVVQSS